MSQPFAPYLVVRQHETEIEWFLLEASGNQKAIACFTDGQQAHEYLQDHGGQALDWSIVRMEWDEFLRWLRSNLTKGVDLLVINPKAGQHDSLTVPIFQFLVETEGE